MASILRGVMVSLSMVAAGAAMACDPKVGDIDDGELEQNETDDDDDDPSASGPDTDAATTGDDGDDLPGTSVGSGPDEPDCGDGGEACPQPPPPVQHAYAIRFGDLPPIDVGETDTGGSGGGTEIDPDTLLVVITTGPDDCDDPWAALACGQWTIHFSLPPGTEPGSYALFPDLNGGTTATGPADEIGECWWGGGTLEGTVELTAVEGTVVGRIHDAQSFDFDANVEFSATLCE